MSKIANAFKDGKAFIGFLTAGDPTIEKTVEMELETFDNLAKKTIEEKKKEPRKREETLVGSSGFVSYILLGAISFIVFIGLLYLFVK